MLPPHALTGEVHHTIIVDGIRVGGMVCLIARTTSYVVAWVWVPYESSQYWTELLQLLPQPEYVVGDGQKGLLKAITICWSAATIQRCQFHAWLNIKAKLTLNPESRAGQQLLQITKDLSYVKTRRQARRWKRKLKHWYKKHHSYIDERTIKQDPKSLGKDVGVTLTHDLGVLINSCIRLQTTCFVRATAQTQSCLAQPTTLRVVLTAKYDSN